MLFEQSKIKKITPVGVRKVCDITVSTDHSYVANGIVNHNSNSPNLQNQPNNERFPVRSSFVATDGYKLICLDYSQIELRVMGHAAQDKRFMDAFWNGEDIHGKVSNDLGIERRHAKIVNFGVLYGMGAQNLARTLGVSELSAKDIIKGYETTYTGYAQWKVKTENFAKKYGYIRNLFGRVRRLPGAFSEQRGLHFQALRQATNTVIQGSSADLIKLAMIKLAKTYKDEKLDAHLLLQVHDELLIEAREDIACQVMDITKHIMETTVKLTVPMEADGKIIDNWAQMKTKIIDPITGEKIEYPSQYEAIKNGTLVRNTIPQTDLWLQTILM